MNNKTFRNISNGKSDGVVLFYMKSGKLYPVGLTENQAELLDLSIVVPFADENMRVDSKPLEYKNIKTYLK